MIDRQRLARLLGGDELAWLLARVRKRLARGESLDTSVTLTDASPEQRTAVHRLLGSPPRRGRTLTVSLPAMDAVIRRSGACDDGLAAAVVELTGDVPDLAAAAATRERQWHAAFEPLESLVRTRPELTQWYQRLRDTGLVRRLAGSPETAAALIAELVRVLHQLPAGGMALATFANMVTGRAHALDDDQPLSTLTLSAARALTGVTGTDAESRRAAWAAVGLLRDDLSTTVLTLNLPGDRGSGTGRALDAWREVGQPVVLTLRQLVHDPPVLELREVFVCENPVVVSTAADRLGSGCAPLVCMSGQPGAAVTHLLRLLRAAGCELRYHGDFEWGGLHIGNRLYDRLGFRPWRFATADYLAAAGTGRKLTDKPVDARWDSELSAAMRRVGVAVEEEHVLDDLLGDLAEPDGTVATEHV